ncbi:MAG: polyisoprenoid-binding protein YceI [Nitriliruptoraceae bacterium]|jgi:polyisoprenoid-binding protein YceI
MTTQLPPAGVWAIEPDHSTVEAVAKHMVITKVRGRFDTISGKVEVADDPLASRIEVTIDAASINTNNADRDGHLRSPDFLDAEANPTVTFVSTAIRAAGDAYEADGVLTLAGKSNPVTLSVQYGGLAQDPWGNTRALLSAATTINRADFGLTWNQTLESGGLLVSKDVKIEIEVQLVQS